MTVTYSAEVATSRGFGCFWKLLFRWRGGIYKLVWPDLFLYISLYYSLTILYRCILEEESKRSFEKFALYCGNFADLIPVSFVLGFYVSIVVSRWWNTFNSIPWPDSLAFFVSAFLHGQDDRGRLMRRTIMRYVNLASTITMICISPCVKKRFPTLDHLVEAGMMLPNEKKVFEQVGLTTVHCTYWMPLVWASSIATRARKEGRIRDDFALNTIVDAIASYRRHCGGLFNYDWISIPLVYTQVVTLAVYVFFVATLLGRQHLDPKQGYEGHDNNVYFPVFNFLQFFFYMGWLKVAETLVNPFGEDDDDFEMNYMLDRNYQVSYLIVDEMHQEHPELIRDQYWDDIMPSELPYTAGSEQFRSEPPQGSAAQIIVSPKEAEIIPLTPLEEEEDIDVKVNPNHFIPVSVKSSLPGNYLSRQLSASTRSSISGLGNPRQNIMSHLNRLFSRERVNGSSVSLQSSRRKRRSKKQNSKEAESPGSSASSTPSTANPPRQPNNDYPDDIFHLSDLNLVDNFHNSSEMPTPNMSTSLQLPSMFLSNRPGMMSRHPSSRRRRQLRYSNLGLQSVDTSGLNNNQQQVQQQSQQSQEPEVAAKPPEMKRERSSSLKFIGKLSNALLKKSLDSPKPPKKSEQVNVQVSMSDLQDNEDKEDQDQDHEASDSDEPTIRVADHVPSGSKGLEKSGSLSSVAPSLSPDEGMFPEAMNMEDRTPSPPHPSKPAPLYNSPTIYENPLLERLSSHQLVITSPTPPKSLPTSSPRNGSSPLYETPPITPGGHKSPMDEDPNEANIVPSSGTLPVINEHVILPVQKSPERILPPKSPERLSKIPEGSPIITQELDAVEPKNVETVQKIPEPETAFAEALPIIPEPQEKPPAFPEVVPQPLEAAKSILINRRKPFRTSSLKTINDEGEEPTVPPRPKKKTKFVTISQPTSPDDLYGPNDEEPLLNFSPPEDGSPRSTEDLSSSVKKKPFFQSDV